MASDPHKTLDEAIKRADAISMALRQVKVVSATSAQKEAALKDAFLGALTLRSDVLVIARALNLRSPLSS